MIARVPRFAGTIERLLAAADIRVNGSDPWDFQVRNERVFARILAHGSLGLGESYLDGDWDCAQLDEFFHRILRSGVQKQAPRNLRLLAAQLRARCFNLQTTRRAFIPAQVHYDLGNDLFEATFDTRLTGSCGYWREARDLDAAQDAKHDLICRKLYLTRGQTVFDIGCGWGAFMKFSAERYGVQCTGTTVSREQVAWGSERCPRAAGALHPGRLSAAACRCQRAPRPPGLHGHVRARGQQELPRLFQGRKPPAEG